MLKEALSSICEAEAEADKRIIIAGENAQKSIEDAKEAGIAAIERTLARAETEIAHLTRLAELKATESAKELASKTANRKATIIARAERRLDTAAKLIVERIVKT